MEKAHPIPGRARSSIRSGAGSAAATNHLQKNDNVTQLKLTLDSWT